MVRHARRVDARRRAGPPVAGGCDRVDRARPVLRAGLAASPVGGRHLRTGRGTPAWITGRILDAITREPIGDAELDVWQNGDNRLYAVQDASAPEHHLRGRFRTTADGSYAFLAVRPVPYPIPDDGPVGQMLAAAGRHPWRPAHIHLIVRADGYQTLVTHVFDRESPYLDSDAVFAVKSSLLRDFEQRAADDPDIPPGVEGPWCSMVCDLLLAPEDRA